MRFVVLDLINESDGLIPKKRPGSILKYIVYMLYKKL